MDEPIVQTEEQPVSVLQALSEKRRAIADTKEAYIPVPGYDSAPPILLVKYRLLSGNELNVIGERVMRQVKGRWERQLQAAAQTLVAACDGIFYDMEDGSGPQPLTYSEQPITGFTEALASALGFADKVGDINRPTEVLFALFGNNEVMVSQHSIRLNRWMTDTSIEVSAETFPNL